MKQDIHIINPFKNACGGSENRALQLYDFLNNNGHEIQLWSLRKPHPMCSANHPIRKLSLFRFSFPRSGTFVFTGVYFRYDYGKWIYFTRPERVIVIYNTLNPEKLTERLNLLSRISQNPVEVVHSSEWMKKAVNIPGIIEPSPIDINLFKPGSQKDNKSSQQSFTVGRLSRDTLVKFHKEDPELFVELVNQGCKIRIMGGTCLDSVLPVMSGIELLPVVSIPAQSFLQGLDCFFYRTSKAWREPYGRVVMEAMACGLPVVCDIEGGHVDFVEHGVNGFICKNSSEAINIILELKRNPSLRKTIAVNARRDIEKLYSQEALAGRMDYYLNKPVATSI